MNRIVKQLVLIFSFVIISSPLFSQADKILAAMSGAKHYQTKNGIKVTCIKNQMNDASFCRIFFEPEPSQVAGKYELAKMTGLLLCEGTDTLDPILYKNAVNEKGIIISSGHNFIAALSSGSNFDTIFSSIAMPLEKPRFDKNKLKKFKKNYKGELKFIHEPQITSMQASKYVYEKGNLCDKPSLQDSLDILSAEDCAQFYKSNLKSSNKHIVVITNAPADTVFSKAELYFTQVGVQKAKKKKTAKNPPLPENIIYFFHDDDKKYIEECDFASVTLQPQKISPEELHKELLASSSFGNSQSGYFVTELKSSYKLGTNCSAEIDNCNKSNMWSMQSTCKADKIAEAVLASFDIKKSFLTVPVADAQLRNAGNNLNREFQRNILSLNEVTKMLHNIQENELDQNFYYDFSDRLKNTSPTEITDFMSENFSEAKMLTLIKGNIDLWFNELLKLTNHSDIHILKNDTIVEIIKKGFNSKRLASNFLKKTNSEEISKKGQIVKAEGTYVAEGKSYPIKMTTYRKKEKFSSELWLYLDSASYFLKPRKVKYISNGTEFEKTVIDTITRILIEKKVYNGNKGILITAELKKELKNEDLLDVIALSKPFDALNYFVDSTETEIIGRFTEDTVTFYSVKARMPSGKEQFDYYDAKTKLHIRTEFLKSNSGEQVDKTIYFSDYRTIPKTGGKQIPYTKNIVTDRREMILHVKEVNFNAKIKRDLFKINIPKEAE